MEAILLKILAFIVAIGILVAVHEFGHFWVARKLGVKVLRFSIGFGRPLWRRVGKVDQIEYVVAAIPLGGYVKMLDEREGLVDPAERARAFNNQSLKVRSAIVVAGPLFNFIFAILAYWAVLMLGETGLRSQLGEVSPDGLAEVAGLQAGDVITEVNGEATPTWGLVVQSLATAAVADQPIALRVQRELAERELSLPAESIGDPAEIPDLLAHLGMAPARPAVPAVIGKLLPGEPAEQAGLQVGDRVLRVDEQPVDDWRDWVKLVQASPGQALSLEVQRGDALIELTLIPRPHPVGEQTIGRIGAVNQPPADGFDSYYINHQLGPLAALSGAIARTGEYSWLTLKVMWRIVTLQASVKNLSGPLTIADAAGKTASYGLVHFLKFLAIVSISLGVLNLLPIPVLDGGHLVYFAIEGLRGRPLSEATMLQAQQIGMTLLASLMALAFYLDLQRFFG